MLNKVNKYLIAHIYQFILVGDVVASSYACQSLHLVSMEQINCFKNDLFLYRYIFPEEIIYSKYSICGNALYWMHPFIQKHHMMRNPSSYHIILNKLTNEDLKFMNKLTKYLNTHKISLNIVC